jgi:hypothetical protein
MVPGRRLRVLEMQAELESAACRQIDDAQSRETHESSSAGPSKRESQEAACAKLSSDLVGPRIESARAAREGPPFEMLTRNNDTNESDRTAIRT